MSKIALGAVSLLVGLQLFGAAASAQTLSSNQLVNIKQAVRAASTPHPAPAKPAAAPKPAPVMVTVEEGDTLNGIATDHSTTYVRIYDANDSINDPDIINPGQQLRIPQPEEQLPDRPLPVDAPVAAAPAPTPVTTPNAAYAATPVVSPVAVASPVVGNDAKAFIYAHESGNNPNATSPNGCYGLGQDCNGVVRAQCGADYACQDAYFTSYALRRYGSWEAAAAFWTANGWW